jgi:hypothetical protein
MQFVKPINSEQWGVLSQISFSQSLMVYWYVFLKKFAFLDLLEVRSPCQLGEWMMD